MTMPSSFRLKEKSNEDNVLDEKEKPVFPSSYKPKKEEENIIAKTLKEYGKSALKGFVEGTTSLGRMLGPLRENKQGEFSEEKQTEVLNKLLPTEDTFGQNVIRRGLKIAPSAIASPFGGAAQAATRSGIAGVLGESVKQVGGGDLAQSLAELSAYTTPSFTKNLVEKGKYEPLVKAAKKFGMSSEEIAPLIQSNFKQKWLSKVAKKTGRAEERLSKTKSALDRSYEMLNESPDAVKTLSTKSSNDLLTEISGIAKKLPSEVRERISQDMVDLVEKPITGQSLINIWKDINYYLGKGEKQLGLFKVPVKKAIDSISPELGKDFGLVNDLYKKYYPIVKNLKPNQVDKFMSAAESLGLIGSVATWNLPGIGSILGEHSARLLAREMLINPRFQQISNKMMVGIKNNSLPIFNRASSEMQKLVDENLTKISNKESQKKHNNKS